MRNEFWEFLDRLVDSSQVILDRPKGSTHPRYPQQLYPVSYGYLTGTAAIDAGSVDIWLGSLAKKMVVGVLCTVDLLKRDTELKILNDCTDDEIATILNFVNGDQMQAIVIKRDQ